MEEAVGLGIVGDEELLVALAPGELAVSEADIKLGLEQVEELEQGHAVLDTTADVEGLAAGLLDVFEGCDVASYGVGNVEEVADLLAVAGDGEGLAHGVGLGLQRLAAEPANPALIEGGELAAAVDGGVAEDDRVEAETAGVVEHVLIGGALGAAVRGVELDGGGLVDAAMGDARLVAAGSLDEVEVLEVAVDLVA